MAVSARIVREWLRVQGMEVGSRGRLLPDHVELWNYSHPRPEDQYLEPKKRIDA